MLACILDRIGATLRGALAWIGVSLVGLVIALVIAFVVGNLPGFAIFALILGALVVTAVLAAIVVDVILCLTGAGPPPPSQPASGSGLTSEMDCPTAQRLLAEAKAKLARLRAEIDAQALRVQAAQQALVTARTALTLALAGLGGSFFFPWTIPAAVAAVAAAAYMVTNAARQIAAESERLRRLAEQLADAQREVAAYEGVVSQACRTTVIPTPPVGGITIAALTRVLGSHERLSALQ